jgi:hypothetical protein
MKTNTDRDWETKDAGVATSDAVKLAKLYPSSK